MAKFIYRLDLTEEELDSIKDKLDDEIIKKLKKIEISDKKIASAKKATDQKIEIARIRCFHAVMDLQDEGIEATQYNLRKYKNISYPSSKKYFELLSCDNNEYDNDDLLPEDIDPETLIDSSEMIEYEKYILEKYKKRSEDLTHKKSP